MLSDSDDSGLDPRLFWQELLPCDLLSSPETVIVHPLLHRGIAMAASGPYGRRLIPNIIDERARIDPERPVFSIPSAFQGRRLELDGTFSPRVVLPVPVSSNPVSQGFRDISARTFAYAVDRVAWLLDAEVGKGLSFPSIAYIGPRRLLR